MTPEEAAELFSELDESGVLDPVRAKDGDARRRHAPRAKVDPLSEQDPSGSQVGRTISRTALTCIVGVLVLVVGMQVAYGVSRRLNTANLSEEATRDTVRSALESGVEWGNGFTQFPSESYVDEADEETGTVEVSVVDTDSADELELLSNSQIQAAALATNALLNDKIDRVVYNVYVLTDRDGNFQHDRFFGFVKADGTLRAMLTFIWTKEESTDGADASNIDWSLKIVGMDADTTAAIQKQVNSVSSITEEPALSQSEIDQQQSELDRAQEQHGAEALRGARE